MIRGAAHVRKLEDKVREARLRWYGHVQRREEEYIGRRILQIQLLGRRRRRRPRKIYMYIETVKENTCTHRLRLIGIRLKGNPLN